MNKYASIRATNASAAQTNPAPVDVLAVLDAAALKAVWERDSNNANSDHQRGEAWERIRSDLRKSSAAVAELIEAAAELRAAHRELPGRDHPAEVREVGEARIGRAHYALDAALVRVQGGAK